MKTLKKIWAFLKTHWYLPLMLVGLIIAVILAFTGNNKGFDRLVEMFNKARNKYEEEIDIIEENQRLKKQEKKKNQEKYDQAIMELEKKIQIKRNELNKSQKKKVQELLDKHGNDYDSMVKEMAEQYGFEVK